MCGTPYESRSTSARWSIPSRRYSPSIVGSGRYTRMSPVRIRLVTRRTATMMPPVAARRRRLGERAADRAMLAMLVARDDQEQRAAFYFCARAGRDPRDPTGTRRAQLVLHLHRLERRNRSVGLDEITLFHVEGLQQPWHGRSQLGTPAGDAAGGAAGTQRAFVDDRRLKIDAVHIEPQRVVRHDGDLVARALDGDRPLAGAYHLANIGRHGPVVERETPVRREVDLEATIAKRHDVSHQRRASSRPARAHAESNGGEVIRIVCDRAKRTAPSAPATAAPSLSSATRRGFQRLTNPVSYRPDANV